MNQQKKCKYCKSKINATAHFCPNCGKKQGMPTANKAILTIAAILIVLVGIGSCDGSDDSNTNTSNTEIPMATDTVVADFAEVNSEPEHGTSEYVDYIFTKAKNDSKNVTNVQLQEAVDWLKNNTNNYFSGEENMEMTMYYGELLERTYKGTGNVYEQVGWQAFKTVKYVYRGVDSISDPVTQDNLVELKDMLSDLPDIK